MGKRPERRATLKSHTFTAVFDGQVLRPETPPELEVNGKYLVTINETSAEDSETGDAWDLLEQATGSLQCPADWSSEHDHYLYGSPKRHSSIP